MYINHLRSCVLFHRLLSVLIFCNPHYYQLKHLFIALPPRVINIADAPPDWHLSKAFTYIGRNKCWGDTIWGNPFKLSKSQGRLTIIEQYINLSTKQPPYARFARPY